ncbi:TatD family hydrolase, partial [Rhizobium hidalgonense]
MQLPALIDTHTHFDVADFDADRLQLAELAYQRGVKALVLIGFLAERFNDMLRVQQQINDAQTAHPQALLAPGLHPFYIQQHTKQHLQQLEQLIKKSAVIAIGEIGLDTFTAEMKQPEVFAK